VATILIIFLKINCPDFSRLVWCRHTCHIASGATVLIETTVVYSTWYIVGTYMQNFALAVRPIDVWSVGMQTHAVMVHKHLSVYSDSFCVFITPISQPCSF